MGQFHRFIDDALLFVVVTHLDITGQRKILAQGMALESVVGKYAPQVRVAGEINAVKVPDLALPPIGRTEQLTGRRHRRIFIGPYLNANAKVVGQAEKIVNDRKAGFLLRIVDTANVDQLLELAIGVIAQEVEPILPEVVSTTKDDVKTVDYAKLPALLIESVKELSEEVRALKRQKI